MGVPEVAVMLPRKRSRLCLSKPPSTSFKKSVCSADGSKSLNTKESMATTDETKICGSFSTDQVDDNCNSDNKGGVADMKDSMVHAANLPSTCDPLVPPVASLHNLGNTCFLNCMLEVLRYTPGFLKGISNLYGQITAEEKRQKEFSERKSDKIEETIPPAWQLLKNANAMFTEMKSRENSYKEVATSDAACMAVGPSALLESIREMNPMFDGHFQHDAQELLRCLLCYIEDAEREVQRSVKQHQDKETIKQSEEERAQATPQTPDRKKRFAVGFATVKRKASPECAEERREGERSRVQVKCAEVWNDVNVKDVRGKGGSTGPATASSTFMENYLFGDNALQMRGGRGRPRKVPTNRNSPKLKGSVIDLCDENCPLQTASPSGHAAFTSLSSSPTGRGTKHSRPEQIIIVDSDEDEPLSKHARVDQEKIMKDNKGEEGGGPSIPDLVSSVISESQSGQKATLPLITISSGTAKASVGDRDGASAAYQLRRNKENLFRNVQQDLTKSPLKALENAVSPTASSMFPSSLSGDGTKMKQTSMLSLFNLLGRFHRLGMRGRVLAEKAVAEDMKGGSEDKLKLSWPANTELKNNRNRNGLKSIQTVSVNDNRDSSDDSIQLLHFKKTEESVSMNAEQSTMLDVDRISSVSEVDAANFDSIIDSVTQKYYSSLSPSRRAWSDAPSLSTRFSGPTRSSLLPSFPVADGCSSTSSPNKVLKPEEELIVHSPSKMDGDWRRSPRKSPRKRASTPVDSCGDAGPARGPACRELDFASLPSSVVSTSDSYSAEHEPKALFSSDSVISSPHGRPRDLPVPGSSVVSIGPQAGNSTAGDALPRLKIELKKCDWLGVSPVKSVSAKQALRHMGVKGSTGHRSVCRSMFMGDVKSEAIPTSNHLLPSPVSKESRRSGRRVEKLCKTPKNCEHKKLLNVSVSLTSCDWLGARLDFPISAKKALRELEQSGKKTRTGAKCVRAGPEMVKSGNDSMTTGGKHAVTGTLVESLFGGTMMHRTRCIQCEKHRDRKEAFLDISVPVRSERGSEEDRGSSNDEDEEEEKEDCRENDAKGSNSCLSRLMQAFSGVERLVGDNKYFCDHCLCYTEAERSCHYTSMPAVLTLHLKRFCSNPRAFGGVSKINDPVSIPLHLPCLQYGCPQGCSKPEHRYTLFGIVTHSGVSILHGHYRAYVKVLPSLNPDLQTYMHSDSSESTTSSQTLAPTQSLKDTSCSLSSERPGLKISDGGDSVGLASLTGDCKAESWSQDGLVEKACEKKEKREAEEVHPRETSESFSLFNGQKEEERRDGVKDSLWLECDDECIRVMTESEFTGRLEESCRALMGTPYVLFYHKMDRLM